jgi:transposase
MTQYVGLDVSMKETKLHVLDEAGKRLWRGQCPSEPAAIAAAVRRYAPSAVRIGLETGPLTTWLWTELTAEGLPMVCLDARHAKKALDMKVNKTDANDAEGLAHLVRGRLVPGSSGQRSWRHAYESVARRAQSVAEHVIGA